MMPRPSAPVPTVAIEKPVPLGVKEVWVVLSRRFTEAEAFAWLAAHPTHRRVVK